METVDHLKAEVFNWGDDNRALEEEIKDLETKVTSLTQNLMDKTVELEKMKEEYEEKLDTQLQLRRKTIKTLNGKLTEKEKVISEIKAEKDSTLSNYKSEIDKNEKLIQNLVDENTGLKDKVTTVFNELMPYMKPGATNTNQN